MRLLNCDDDRTVSRLAMLLTVSEASELRDSLEALLGAGGGHEHVSSADFTKEITVAVYDISNLESFGERFKRLVREDR